MKCKPPGNRATLYCRLNMNINKFFIQEASDCTYNLQKFVVRDVDREYSESLEFDPSVEISYIPNILSAFLDEITGGKSIDLTGCNGRGYGVVLSSSDAFAYLAYRSVIFRERMKEKILELQNDAIPKIYIAPDGSKFDYSNLFRLWTGGGKIKRSDGSNGNEDMCDAMLVPFYIDECGNSYLVRHDYPTSSGIVVCELGEERSFSRDSPRHGVIDLSIAKFFSVLAEQSMTPVQTLVQSGKVNAYSLVNWINVTSVPQDEHDES